MKSKILVIPKKSTKGMENYEKGDSFERLIRNILELQKYEIEPNVHFTGLEIDLIAKHKYDNKTLYVECKAKEKVRSTEIKNFGFNVFTKKPDYAYFIHTVELDKQASALKIEQFNNNSEFKNVSFYGPNKIIELLIDSSKIRNIPYDNLGQITQQFLIVSYLGDYIIYIGQESLAYPTYYYVYNAQSGKALKDTLKISSIIDSIPEIKRLDFKFVEDTEVKSKSLIIPKDDFEIVAEVQAGDDWFDYKPAHYDYFVGRENLKTDTLNFFRKVRTKDTSKRAFYLKGKSGWGKSSLVNAIKGTCERRYYSNKYYTVAFDCRSASTENFVAKAFLKAIEKTFKSDFVNNKKLDLSKIKFTSNYSLLDSEFVINYLKFLENNDKLLVIIFDQFEDVFRKTDIFKYFYKFLSDVSESQSNLIVGFSWKSEFYIQPDIPSYSWFQQAKEQSLEFIVPEFGVKETNGILKQLEKSVQSYLSEPLNNDIKNRLIENSQGFPWLIKKLCIHIFQQIKNGQSIDDLIDDNLNIKSLFEADLSDVVQKEQKALELVANKAVSGKLFDENDISEYKLAKEIKSLIDKRLIIRSGYNYNVYWDIFRDYLVNGEVPLIRRGYIFKQGPQACLKVFLSFNENRKQDFKELHSNQKSRIGVGSLGNILIELRNFELVKKVRGKDIYSIPDNITINKSTFKKVIKRKVLEFSTFNKLEEIETKSINIEQISSVLKEIFKSVSHKEKTWKTYSRNFANWLKFLDIDVSKRIVVANKGKALKNFDTEKETIILRSNPFDLFEIFQSFIKGNLKNLKNNNFLRDFRILKIIQLKKGAFELTDLGNNLMKISDKNTFYKKISELSLELDRIRFVFNEYKQEPFTSTYFIETYPNFFEESKANGTKTIYTSSLISWARFNIWVMQDFTDLFDKEHINSISKKRVKAKSRSYGDYGVIARNKKFYNDWLVKYNLLLQYYNLYNHSNVPARYKINNIALGNWVVRQRSVKNSLKQSQIELLNEINFDWNPNETEWMKMYNELLVFYKMNKHSNIPVIYSKNPHLGVWCFKQRQNYKSSILKKTKIDLLNNVEFVWFPQDASFEKNIKLLSDYFIAFGDFSGLSRKKYRSLSNWLNAQKRHYKKGDLSNDKIAKFKSIGYDIENICKTSNP